jgi:NAD(P)-dependent dehydrogenase (short-subunit alcohol dehydrogenase family)
LCLGRFREIACDFSVNLNSVFFLTQLVANVMLKQKDPDPAKRGNIINISSIMGMHGSYPNNQVAYVSSKGAC